MFLRVNFHLRTALDLLNPHPSSSSKDLHLCSCNNFQPVPRLSNCRCCLLRPSTVGADPHVNCWASSYSRCETQRLRCLVPAPGTHTPDYQSDGGQDRLEVQPNIELPGSQSSVLPRVSCSTKRDWRLSLRQPLGATPSATPTRYDLRGQRNQ